MKMSQRSRAVFTSCWTAFSVALLGLTLLLVSLGWTAVDANPQTSTTAASVPNSPVPNLSGYWELTGSLRINGKQEKPVYTPQALARQEQQRVRAQAGQVVSETSRYCRTMAFPFFMGSSPPFNIIQGPNEIIVLAEREMASRHIFMDRGHPAPEMLEPSFNGDSVGHWDGDTLVIDTIGFKYGEGESGSHGPNTHSVERYKLTDGGKRLSVTFTWEDPDTYLKPYTYERIYDRSPADRYAMEDWCDASDSLQWISDAKPNLTPQKKSN